MKAVFDMFAGDDGLIDGFEAQLAVAFGAGLLNLPPPPAKLIRRVFDEA